MAVVLQRRHAGPDDVRGPQLVTGVLALVLGALLAACVAVPRWALLVWNVLGLGLLVNVVTVANLSFPTPFRRFPEVTVVATYPYIWLPCFLVPAALAGHLLLFRRPDVTRRA